MWLNTVAVYNKQPIYSQGMFFPTAPVFCVTNLYLYFLYGERQIDDKFPLSKHFMWIAQDFCIFNTTDREVRSVVFEKFTLWCCWVFLLVWCNIFSLPVPLPLFLPVCERSSTGLWEWLLRSILQPSSSSFSSSCAHLSRSLPLRPLLKNRNWGNW